MSKKDIVSNEPLNNALQKIMMTVGIYGVVYEHINKTNMISATDQNGNPLGWGFELTDNRISAGFRTFTITLYKKHYKHGIKKYKRFSCSQVNDYEPEIIN